MVAAKTKQPPRGRKGGDWRKRLKWITAAVIPSLAGALTIFGYLYFPAYAGVEALLAGGGIILLASGRPPNPASWRRFSREAQAGPGTLPRSMAGRRASRQYAAGQRPERQQNMPEGNPEVGDEDKIQENRRLPGADRNRLIAGLAAAFTSFVSSPALPGYLKIAVPVSRYGQFSVPSPGMH